MIDNEGEQPERGKFPGVPPMDVSTLHYLTDEYGELTAVVVPIAVWREIRSELETQYLLKSDAMRQRLLDARSHRATISIDDVMNRLGVADAELETE